MLHPAHAPGSLPNAACAVIGTPKNTTAIVAAAMAAAENPMAIAARETMHTFTPPAFFSTHAAQGCLMQFYFFFLCSHSTTT
jgi:hypothetical protein